MPLIKKKPVLLIPLPPLSSVLHPLQPANLSGTSPNPSITSPTKSKSKIPLPPVDAVQHSQLPVDGKDDEEQADRLLSALRGELVPEALGVGVKKSTVTKAVNGNAGGVEVNGLGGTGWRLKNVDVWYVQETGEVFLDYESYSTRIAFYLQPIFQCEVSAKSGLTYFDALRSENKEIRQLHSRFPRQLKKAVLSAVQFQIEGKLDHLADKLYERFANRFFDEEKVFVDVTGDKFLARIVTTFPPKSLPPGSSTHPYATDLSVSNEQVLAKDDPMKYFYSVRLVQEGAEEGIAVDYSNGSATGLVEENGDGGEKWQSSTMEVQADKISRDRINFSRAMLKRFIRDCVTRDPAVYSPWLVKPPIANRYGIPTEMSEEIKEGHLQFRIAQLEKRKREREGRLGIGHDSDLGVEEDEKPKKKSKNGLKEEKVETLEDKKKALKYPAEDLLVEYVEERDGVAGRLKVRPPLIKDLPFGDSFEKFLMAWSFLNVMGKPLALSPFTLDEFEQSLYHSDPWTSPVPLITEIHSTLLNALIRDGHSGHETVRPLATFGELPENNMDYWEGKKGATADTIRSAAESLAHSWSTKPLSIKEGRKGWEGALVGCLWERATLETLPNYLDNLLDLLFEDKPAPTRPTWSTGPSNGNGTSGGLTGAKPEKKYCSLHFLHKLEIISFLIDMVAQTTSIRDFLEESTAALTEVRKDQVEVKREWKRILAEKEVLDPKKKGEEDGEAEVDADGDVSTTKKEETPTEADELDLSPPPFDGSESRSSTPHLIPLESGPSHAAASRRRIKVEKAQAQELAETMKIEKLANDKVSIEKKRIQEEEEVTLDRLKELDYDFRSYMYTLRARPLGWDRFGNKIWWMDGLGSSPLRNERGVTYGTGRLYLQGVDEMDLEWWRQSAEMSKQECEGRRAKEEGGSLAPGEWGMYDTPDQVKDFMDWLNPRGVRELALVKQLRSWWSELEAGMKKRRLVMGLDAPDGIDEPARKRNTRKTAHEEEKEGYLGWKSNSCFCIDLFEMHSFESLLSSIQETIAPLQPITLPLAPIQPLSSFLHHITTRHVHPTYFPYALFGAIHAARVTTLWVGATKGRRKVSTLQDLFGYLVQCWGGGTVVSLLLSQPPSWLISPTPWIVYTTVYTLLVPTGLSSFVVKTAPTLLFNLVGAYVDGITRGITITGISSLGAFSWWTEVVLSGLAACSGGWIMQSLNLAGENYQVGKPTILNGGLLDTLDLWGAMAVGLVYGGLMRAHEETGWVGDALEMVLPEDIRGKAGKKIEQPVARAICALLMGSLLAARVITVSTMGWRTGRASRGKAKNSSVLSVKDETAPTKVVKSPVEVGRGTPRKSPRKK
ncbi:hypothetical protein P7C73_g1979, partial [Tremellales sp. Uapishka_1]